MKLKLTYSIALMTLCYLLITTKGYAQDPFISLQSINYCESDCYFVSALATNFEPGPYYYSWSDGSSGSSSITMCYPDCYSVTVVNGLGNEMDTSFCAIDIFEFEAAFEADYPCSSSIHLEEEDLDCEQVCVGATISYSFEMLELDPGTQIFISPLDVGGVTPIATVFEDYFEVTWDTPGNYTLEALATYSEGPVNCFAEMYQCVSVTEPPSAAINSTPSPINDTLYLCLGQPAYFEYIGSDADSLYWEFGDGGISSELEPDYSYTETGVYELQLTAFTACTCNDTITMNVVVEDAETPIVDCVGTLCTGMLGTYTTASNCDVFTWSISDNGSVVDGGDLNDNFITVQWNGGAEGTVTLSAQDCTGATCPEPATLQVPIISEDISIEGPELVCRGEISIYTIPAYEGTTIEWAVSSGGILQMGQGTNEISVYWSDSAPFDQDQTVSVAINNCYLDCGATAEKTVSIKPEFLIEGSIEACENETGIYNAVNIDDGSPLNAYWILEDANGNTLWQSSNAIDSPVVPFPADNGIYRLSAFPANPEDFCKEIQVKTIFVLPTPPPVEFIVGNSIVCPGSLQNYQAITSTEDITLQWQVVNGSETYTIVGNPVNIIWGDTPPYELSVVQINTLGLPCTSEAVFFEAEPFGNLTLDAPVQACQGSISTLTTTHTDFITYNWTITPASAGTIISEPEKSSIEIIWHEAGPVEVSVTACGSTASTDLVVLPQLSLNIIHPTELCPNEVASVSTPLAYESYEWINEAGVIVSTASNPDLGPGYYLLIATNEYGCTIQRSFHIEALPSSEVHISTPDEWYFCNQTPFTQLFATSSTAGYQYQWFKDDAPIGNNSPTYTATDFGTYYVSIIDENGCTSISNEIEVIESCAPPWGGSFPALGISCGDVDMDFSIEEGASCIERVYQNLSSGMIANSEIWLYFNPSGNTTSFGNGPSASIEFEAPGYYQIGMINAFPSPLDPNDSILCILTRVDTVLAVANFEASTVCINGTTEFEDLSTYLPNTTITAWQWDFGDPASGASNFSDLQHPNHVFSTSGIFTVTLTITAGGECVSQFSKEVEVIAAPEPIFDEPAASCANTASHFTAFVSGAIVYEWDFGDPASGTANQKYGSSTYHRYDSPGTYTVSLYTENIYGCAASFSQDITIVPNPLNGAISSNLPSPICEGDTAILEAPPGGISWLWSNGATTPSTNAFLEGIYNVTITDTDGCVYIPSPIEIDVIPGPETYIRGIEYDEYGQPLAYYYEEYETCYGEPVFLETEESTNYSYEWSSGEPSTIVEYSEEKENLLEVGTNEIILTVTDISTGCSSLIGPFNVIVHPLPDLPSINSTQADPICEGEEVTLSVSNPIPGITYEWNNGESGTSITTQQAGLYTVTAINEFGCSQESEAFEILPGPPTFLIPNGCYTRCNPDTICLPEINGVVSYQWYFNNNPVAPPSGNMPEIIIQEEGSYFLEMLGENGCVLQTDPLDITLFDGLGSFVGQSYMDVNENGIIDTADTLVSNIGIQLWQSNSQQDQINTENGSYGFIGIPSNLDYELVIDTTTLAEFVQPLWMSVDTTLSGCDAVITVNWLFTLNCSSSTLVELSACAGEIIHYNGIDILAGETGELVYSNANGCDSTVTVLVEAIPVYDSSTNLIACEGETLYHDGQALQVGTNTFNYTSILGCDSTITILLENNTPSITNIVLGVCPDSSILFHGEELSMGDSTSILLTDQYGCDSLVVASVVTQAVPQATFEVDGQCPDFPGTISTNIDLQTTPPYFYAIDNGTFTGLAAFTDLESGQYLISVKDANGCSNEYEVFVPEISPLQATITQDEMSCDNLSATLSVDILSGNENGFESYWTDGIEELYREINIPGVYTLEVSNECETISESIQVLPPHSGNAQPIYIPSAFSPNGDGVNDLFETYTGIDIEILEYDLMVFDRWGGMLFRSDTMDEGWDGHCKGQLLNTGVYVWVLKAKVIACGREILIEDAGDVALVR
ncbi:MAG: PKD domain-containing protein [Chitinophagales bacterium]|nr:PKD domain-containing protein [Chitinophagales bacterium]